jgi:pyruvate kinase
VKLLKAGMNIARFNFSHGDVAGHTACLMRLREAIKQTGMQCAVLLDTKGPEIRTGFVDPELGGKVTYVKDSIIEVGTNYDRKCTPDHLSCSYPGLVKSVSVGSRMLCADGAIVLEVTELLESSVKARVLNNASFGDRKNMNLPGAIVDLPTCTPRDEECIREFAVAQKVDFIAASFVRKGTDIDYIRQVCGEEGKAIMIIAKVENQEGLQNYEEILAAADGIMVARGDLGMEIPIERVFLAQKMMIEKANAVGRPIVTATQVRVTPRVAHTTCPRTHLPAPAHTYLTPHPLTFPPFPHRRCMPPPPPLLPPILVTHHYTPPTFKMLESMITNPRPTRAECADVANAVLDGTCAVMLSGEVRIRIASSADRE